MPILRQILGDARFALRLLRRSPGFGATILTVLVVGIGATTAMFSLVASLLLRPLPYPNPEELTLITGRQPMVDRASTSLPDFLDLKAEATTFERMSAMSYEAFSLSSPGAPPVILHGATVSGDFFPLLGIAPHKGRFFGPDDDRPSGPRVAVLSAAVWRTRFASDPGIVGRVLTLNAEPFTVIGVAPEGFRFSGPHGSSADVWAPLAVTRREYATDASEERRGSRFLSVVGRRKPGVSLAQAQAQVDAIVQGLEVAHPESNRHVGARVEDLQAALVGSSRDGIWVLFSAVALVFLVMCANVANLLLARAVSRRSEMAARAALGATAGRLAAQLVTETVVLFVAGALGGTILARWLVSLFSAGLIRGGATMIDVQVDGIALGFAIALSVACGIVFGLVPAGEAARLSPQAVLKETSARASMGPTQRALRAELVAVQVALALALLAGSGLVFSAFARLAATSPGFDPDDLATALVVIPESKSADEGRILRFQQEALARLKALPGVTAVTANSQLPMSGSNSNSSFAIEGRPPWPDSRAPVIEVNIIAPDYFRTMGIPLLRGRDVTEADEKTGRLVMLISQSTADRFFPGEDPIGHRIDIGNSSVDGAHRWREIVGVVGDVRRWSLAEAPRFEGYVPATQSAVRWMSLVVRAPEPERVLREMPGIIAAIDPDQALTARRLMRETVDNTIRQQRFVAYLLGAFAAAALVLATLGLFGLVSYTTSQRTRELGIRLALGSSPEAVVAVVMRDGLRLLGLGLAAGLVGAALVGRAVAGRVAGAAAFDPLVFGTIFGVLAAAGVVASLLPALRAVRIPPALALRCE